MKILNEWYKDYLKGVCITSVSDVIDECSADELFIHIRGGLDAYVSGYTSSDAEAGPCPIIAGELGEELDQLVNEWVKEYRPFEYSVPIEITFIVPHYVPNEYRFQYIKDHFEECFVEGDFR